MKARFQMRCECCKQVIHTGSQYRIFMGRPWLTDHVIAFQSRRRQMK